MNLINETLSIDILPEAGNTVKNFYLDIPAGSEMYNRQLEGIF